MRPRIALIRLGFVCFLVVSAWILYRWRSQQVGVPAKVWFGVFAAAVLAGAAADAWQTWFELLPAHKFPLDCVSYSVVFFIALWWVASTLKEIPPRSVIDIQSDPEGRAHLVLFLSEISDTKTYPEGIPIWLTGNDRNLDNDLKTLEGEKRKARLAQQKPNFWPWEQSLRAIYHQLDKKQLKAVTVIPSKESIRQVPMFATLITRYPALRGIELRFFVQTEGAGPQRVSVQDLSPSSKGWSFEDFTRLAEALKDLLAILAGKRFYEPDIMIDFTSGNKVTSVVAAAMTFNSALKAQYVQTEDPWKVLSYSVVTAREPI
jgi:hypothetical protein